MGINVYGALFCNKAAIIFNTMMQNVPISVGAVLRDLTLCDLS